MKTKVIVLLNVLSLFTLYCLSQEKYAIILTGDPTPNGKDIVVPEGDLWPTSDETNEFWHDTFLMNKLLEEKGFLDNNIYVLWAPLKTKLLIKSS